MSPSAEALSEKYPARNDYGERSPLGIRRSPRSSAAIEVLLLRPNDWCVLPPLMCRASSQARKCAVSRDLRRRGKSRVPPLQTLQAEPSIARRTARREDRFRLSPDRKLRNPAQPRTA